MGGGSGEGIEEEGWCRGRRRGQVANSQRQCRRRHGGATRPRREAGQLAPSPPTATATTRREKQGATPPQCPHRRCREGGGPPPDAPYPQRPEGVTRAPRGGETPAASTGVGATARGDGGEGGRLGIRGCHHQQALAAMAAPRPPSRTLALTVARGEGRRRSPGTGGSNAKHQLFRWREMEGGQT